MEERGIITKLAWRSVWRNKRRTILTLLTIVVGCGMIIFMNSIAKGGHDQMINDAAALNTGHIQIHEKGYWENQTIDYAFRFTPSIRAALASDKKVSGYSIRLHAGGLLSYQDTTSGALIQGVDPVLEKNVSNLHTKIIKGGRYLLPGDNISIVIGEILAKNLGVKVGNSIAMISQGFDGSIAAEKLTIVGLFRSGNPEYDRSLVIMPIEQAKETFTMMGYVHSAVVRLKDVSDLVEVQKRLTSKIADTKLELMGWDQLMPELVQFIVMDDVSAYIFDLILFLVVAFGVLNTIQMSVFERTREFGIMLSIGTRPGQLIKMVLLESVFISILGILLGVALGCGVSAYFSVNPIDYSSYANEMAVWGISTTIFPADTTMLNVGVTSGFTFFLSIIFSFFPARRASRLEPVKAIRQL